MSTPDTLPLNSAHVALQFSRRGDLSAAQFLYGEVARRMDERLRLVRLQPDQILDAGCGAGQQVALLHARYPTARYIGQDHSATLLRYAQREAKKYFSTGWPQKLLQWRGASAKAQWLHTDLTHTGLAPESLDLVWSNLALHWHARPHDVLHEWGRILRVNGLVFFSCFGPATCQELRAAAQLAGLNTMTPSFVDMHDFGDLLIEKGFADPVMDQEVLTLTYATPEKLLADVKALGGNPSVGRRAGLLGRDRYQALLAALETQRKADGRLHLTVEVAYGHAWRSGTRRATTGETRVNVSAITRTPPMR
jgi:malonyl-CoA O-methyltransferase